jgi:pimeloyl-ACP methyl ester carboxylesterase
MSAVVDAVVSAGTSAHTQSHNPLAVAATRLSLLGQDPESYAKACSALARATQKLNIENVTARTLIITGDEDKVSTQEMCAEMGRRMRSCEVVVLKDVGHWHVFEDAGGVAKAVSGFLKK